MDENLATMSGRVGLEMNYSKSKQMKLGRPQPTGMKALLSRSMYGPLPVELAVSIGLFILRECSDKSDESDARAASMIRRQERLGDGRRVVYVFAP
ncbi:unnamed protein product [Heligmosomoides polygyrus]|uniref:Histone H2A n=1 Tax=Heligmosomoides polygyrus TaxID=6339 RepID=A0A183FSI2_HELPZ|nr:unnamed protein product [Heligmosomoides polygyrus]